MKKGGENPVPRELHSGWGKRVVSKQGKKTI